MEQKKRTSLQLTNKPQKLIPRDISESLGKLPPQAVDLEESILGALITEGKSFDSIKDILEPEHFYTEAHKIIFTAIKTLGEKGSPIDMRTVTSQLKKDGQIELVGGQFYIAELSSKVASAASIAYHAHAVIETYIKRELILLGSGIHQQGYEDTSDALAMLEEAYEKIKALEEKTLKRSGPQKIKHQWDTKLLTTLPDEPPPIVWIDGCPVMWPGGHSLLVGKKKSRKTLFVVWLVAQYLLDPRTTGKEVLIFDTEQSKRHVYRIREKIHKLTGKLVAVFYLRGMSPQDRKDFIRDTVDYWPTPPQLVVNDGVRDLMKDINSTDESTDLVVWLEKLTLALRPGQQFMPHVINILHLNKGDSNPRGHIGTELLNKADCTIELELDPKAGCTDVRCESSREKPFNTFSFTHDANDLPALVMNSSGEAVSSDDRKKRVLMIFEDGVLLTRKQVIAGIKEQFGVGDNKAGHLLSQFRHQEWIAKIGLDHHPDTKYKIIISENGHHEYHPPEPQPDLFSQSTVETEAEALPASGDDDLPF
jgi:hypothetical protein